jgi:PEGA domain
MRTLSRTALVLSLTLAAGTAAADPSAADRATARTLAQEGQQALDAKKFSVAADKFTRADSLVHAPTLLIGLARAQLGLGKLVEAQESFNRIIREGIAPGSPRSWTKSLDDATKEVDAITTRLPWVTITVLGPTNPEVVIDSTPVPSASLGVKRPVNPGSHTVKASAEGFLPAEKTMVFSEGQSISVGLELEQAPVDAVSPVAALVTTSEAPRSSGNGRKTAGFVALGVGGAGLIVGGVTGFLALGKHSKLADVCPDGFCDPDTQGAALNSYHTMGTIATVGFIVGGVGIATGTILLVTAPKESQSANRATWSPFIGVGSAGVRGSF